MRILFVTENFPPETNAAATRVFERALHWTRWGHQVTVITCAPNFPGGRVFEGYRNRWRQVEEMAGMRVVRMKTFISPNKGVLRRSLDFLSFGITGLVGGLLEQARPDVVVATSPQFFSAVAGWAIGAARRVPFVFELGDLWPASIHAVGAMRRGLPLRMIEMIELFLYRRSAAVVALTGSFKRNLVARGIAAEKIAVVINGVDLSRYAPMARDRELAARWGLVDKFVIGYVGTHGMAHALGNVLDAAERLRGHERLRFVLVGAGAERESLERRGQEQGLDTVVFIPPQPKERMPAIWSLCDVALVHLKNSPVFGGVIPSKIFEAMGMGLPILLAAPEGEASRLLAADHAGVHVPPEDPDALATAALALLADPERLADLARGSLAAAPAHSREHQAREMMRVLEMVHQRRPAGIGQVGEPS